MTRKLLFPLLLLVAANLSATPLFWSITGTFADGGSVSGHFTFDADTTTYSGIDITTTNGTSFTGAHYLVQAALFTSSATQLNTAPALLADYTNTPYLNINFSALTNAGVLTSLGSSTAELNCTSAVCFGNNSVVRFLSTGSLTAGVAPAPEPTAIAMLGFGLVALAALRRRQA